MKTLIYRLRKHNLPLDEKVKVYSQFYERQHKVIPIGIDSTMRHYIAKSDSLKLTDRYLRIYGSKLI